MDVFTLQEAERQALLLSLKVAFWGTFASLPFAITIAYVLARYTFPGKSLLNGFVHLPLILPPVVTGYFLLVTFGRRGPVGAFLADNFGIVFSFRWTGAALAAAVMGFPLMVTAVRLSLEAVDRRFELAASTLGSGPLAIFFKITLPLSMPGIVAGMVLCFAKAMGEFGATITFVSNIPGETQTLPTAIYTFTQIPGGDGPALRLIIISVTMSMGALIAAQLLSNRMVRLTGARSQHISERG